MTQIRRLAFIKELKNRYKLFAFMEHKQILFSQVTGQLHEYQQIYSLEQLTERRFGRFGRLTRHLLSHRTIF